MMQWKDCSLEKFREMPSRYVLGSRSNYLPDIENGVILHITPFDDDNSVLAQRNPSWSLTPRMKRKWFLTTIQFLHSISQIQRLTVTLSFSHSLDDVMGLTGPTLHLTCNNSSETLVTHRKSRIKPNSVILEQKFSKWRVDLCNKKKWGLGGL